jgi:hypothetical protein
MGDDDMVTFRYEGPFDGVEVRHPVTGHHYRAQQGGTIKIARRHADAFRRAEGWVQERASKREDES